MKIQYNFEWDTQKAKTNLSKHKISFVQAATVFNDSRAVTIFDNNHSEDEDRWLTLGMSGNGTVLIVIHTFKEINKNTFLIRIISCRCATKNEKKQYLEV